MSLHFTTRSGAHYEITDERDMIRRIEGNDGNTKRRDGDWLRLNAMWPREPQLGVPATLEIESLAAYGPDDHGTVNPDPDFTTRMTTAVASFWFSPNGDTPDV